MAYLNRNNFGKFWPIVRKGSKYVSRSTHSLRESIPLIIVMRDVLKLVRNAKELKKLINEKQIKINKKEIRVINYPVCLFDILSLESLNKNYKMILLKNKKFSFEEVSEEESISKAYKIISKKILKKGIVQLNLTDGKNIISNEKADVEDSVILNFKDNKILEVVKLKKDSDAVVIQGKHAGNNGKIEEVFERGEKKLVKIKLDDGSKVNVWVKNVIVIK